MRQGPNDHVNSLKMGPGAQGGENMFLGSPTEEDTETTPTESCQERPPPAPDCMLRALLIATKMIAQILSSVSFSELLAQEAPRPGHMEPRTRAQRPGQATGIASPLRIFLK